MALVGESEVPAHRYGVSMAISHLRPVCIMALVGESEVPAHRCGVVIQTVVQQVLGARVPDGDLPSQRSALRISDQAYEQGSCR